MDITNRKDPSSICIENLYTDKELDFKLQLQQYFSESLGSCYDKLQNFPKYIPRQDMTRFLCKYELFKKVLNIQGSIFECGVFLGGGLMSFAQFSSILEPVNTQRQIVGFDTFSGFTQINEKDQNNSEHSNPGGLAIDSYDDINQAIKLYDMNRFINHMPKVELVRGDIIKTLPEYLKANSHSLVSLLYLDLDVYEPTYYTIKTVLPRMPKGSIIAFDELNNKIWPGETLALLENLNINHYSIKRFTFGSYMSYIVLD